MKTLNEMHDYAPLPEVDDFQTAARIVNEMNITAPHMQMYYMALWCARLRENYVEIGREVERLDVAKSST